MKKILVVFGTRPEAIKMAPLIKVLQSHSDYFKTLICVTGQHRHLLDQVLGLFDIKPKYDLNIMKSGQDLYDITTGVMMGLRNILFDEKPDIVMVHGDTTTSMTAALSAFYQNISVGHVESGLRTYNVNSPWPEEMNRQVIGRLSKFHFAPTSLAKNNLLNEGVAKEKIVVTGNTVIDALHWVDDKIKSTENIYTKVVSNLSETGIDVQLIKAWNSGNRKLVLITGHRRENFGAGFQSIFESIKFLVHKYQAVDFVYPMHLNPNIRDAIKSVFGQNEIPDNLFLIEPLEYLPFVFLMSISYIVLTDSGGIQEEAPSLGKPVLVMRDNTERPEAVNAGTVTLVGTNKQTIIAEISSLIEDQNKYLKMSRAINPYGDGKACERIIHFLIENL